MRAALLRQGSGNDLAAEVDGETDGLVQPPCPSQTISSVRDVSSARIVARQFVCWLD
jgi:hypothetical protein